VITEATLKLVHIPSRRRLIVLPYPDVFAAADAVPRLLEDAPIGLEGFDETLVRLMRARPLHLEHLALLPDGGAWLYAEVAGDTDSEADEAAAAFTARLPAGQAWRRFDDPASQAKLWLIRESGLGATALRPDGTHNLEGWEDAAVPPERLGEYLRSLTALWREFDYSGAYYGHFGQGCVHTRNDFDLHSVDGLARFRTYVERAAELVVGLGGSLSGEHGDGRARGELLGRMYGDELLDAFRAFRAAWDPRGRMNPGVLVDADPLDANLRRGPTYRTSSLPGTVPADGLALARDRGSLQAAAERCVGVGRCRRDDAGVMCPSFRATGLEVHSTRGRAKVLAELFQGEITPETWHNDDVRGALDLCLSCKGCAVDCPTGVDMAAYKAEFLHRYYRRRPRPAAALLLGLVPLWARAATRAPRAANAVVALPGIGRVGRRLAGVTARRPVPTFADRPLRRRAEVRRRSGQVDPTVVVWPDTFSDAFTPAAAMDVVAVLEAAGDRVAIPTDWACCGRPLYDSGMLSLARSWLGRLVGVLDPWTSLGVPVVVPEPSCLAAFRDELPALLPDDPRATRLAGLARSPAEHLLASGGVDRLRARINGPRGIDRVAIHPHCHARASGAAAADQALVTALGFDATVVDGGCCGLAGSFGFRREHEALSRTIGEQGWLPALDRASEGRRVVIDGFSCALQLEHLRGGGSTPLMRVVLEAIDGAAPPQGSGA
jgi:Fe-S oxidoreductase